MDARGELEVNGAAQSGLQVAAAQESLESARRRANRSQFVHDVLVERLVFGEQWHWKASPTAREEAPERSVRLGARRDRFKEFEFG